MELILLKIMNKKPITNSLLLVLALLCFTNISHADIKLPAIFGDHMVLQQQTDAAIWGTALANKTVEVMTSWNNKTYSTKSDKNGHWKLKIQTPKAGGPFNISISDGEVFKLNNVLIGEVWVCSGQSNMEMRLKGLYNQPVLGANRTIATSTNKNIRLFTVKRDSSLEKLDDVSSGEWLECHPESVSNFSATAYYFGRMLEDVLKVPVGLICTSWGGTRIESWISENGFKEFDWVTLPNKKQNIKVNHRMPTALFNAMINPLAGLSIKGVLWYQGESNRSKPKKYAKLLPGLIKNWRNEWGIGDFPFYYVQIAPYDYGVSGLNSALLREAQLKALTAVENTGMACLMDVGEKNLIHPSNKQAGGERLAYLALAKTYGIKGIAYSGPVLKDMIIEGPVVKLTFDYAKNGLATFGKKLVNFKVAGKNKHFYPANATIYRKGITLFSPHVKEPVAVRYAFDDFVVGELFNTEGLPASSFRTDDWEVE